MESSTDLARFRALLGAHGGRHSRWPEGSRAWIQSLLERSAEARAALAEQRRVEALLDSDSVPAPSRALESAILAHAPRSPRRRPRSGLRDLWNALGGLRVAGPALAAALLVGLSLGVSGVSPEPESAEDEDLVALAQLSGEYLDY